MYATNHSAAFTVLILINKLGIGTGSTSCVQAGKGLTRLPWQ
jgi:hypothetical protein